MLAALALTLAHAAPSSPNLLVILADDVGADKISSYAADRPGYGEDARFLPQTGVIDDLARAGLRFTAAWAEPICSPTRSAIQTGKDPWRTGIGVAVPMSPSLDPASETGLATALAARGVGDADGYATALFGKWHLGTNGLRGEAFGLGQADGQRTIADDAHPIGFGYQYFDGSLHGQIEDYHAWVRVTSDGSGTSTVRMERTYATDQTTLAARDWITKQTGPWFAFVSLNAGHTAGDGTAHLPSDLDPACPPLRVPTEGTDSERAIYQSVVECMDTRIGQLLHEIPAATLQNTLIVFAGDNGTESSILEGDYADPGARLENGKGTVYETGLRVPFVVADGAAWLAWQACPADQRTAGTCVLPETRIVKPGRTVAAPVSTTDLYATLAALAGAKAGTAVDSTSFAPCFTTTGVDCNGKGHAAYAETFVYDRQTGGVRKGSAGLRQGDLKLVARYQSQARCLRYELYDLAKDPLEWTDLAPRGGAQLTALVGTLKARKVVWMSGLPDCPAGTPAEAQGNIRGGGGGNGGPRRRPQ